MKPFYLAGPFFNDEQRTTMAVLERHCQTLGLPVFSPRLQCFCPPDAPPDKRKDAFHANCRHIQDASFVLARIDDFDPGTMWELGFAYAVGVPTYTFTTVPGRGLNLMIAESGAKFLPEMPVVLDFLKDVRERYDFSRAVKWTKEIV